MFPTHPSWLLSMPNASVFPNCTSYAAASAEVEILASAFLIARYPLSEEAERRLQIMVQTTDGFKIAEEDLAIRGPGDLWGTLQAGLPTFRVGDFFKDVHLLTLARQEAFAILARDPMLSWPEHFFYERDSARKVARKIRVSHSWLNK